MATENLKVAQAPADEDRFTPLPEHILVHDILSLLPTKEAARTSILARRWRFLWLSVPSLDLDASEEVVRVPEERRGTVFPFGGGGKAASSYADRVDGLINAYRGGSALRRFRVLFRLDSAFSRKIESWLFFALAKKGLEVLQLDCILPYLRDYFCEFPQVSPAHYPALRHLKSLVLGSVSITCHSLNHLLQVCEFLERLELHHLMCEGSGWRISVAVPVSRLKSIDIFSCFGLESVIISAPTPDLVSFICCPSLKEVHLEHAPRVAELRIAQKAAGYSDDFDLISHPLFRYVSQLQALRLNIWSWDKAIHWLPRLPDLRRLKHLSLSVSSFCGIDVSLGRQKLHGMASLINAASCLQHLTLLQVAGISYQLDIGDGGFADLDLGHLQVIEMVGFRGREVEWELALLLVKAAAPSLKKLIIDLQEYSLCVHYQKEKIDRWTSRAKELIEKEAPSRGVDLVFTGYRILDDSDRFLWPRPSEQMSLY